MNEVDFSNLQVAFGVACMHDSFYAMYLCMMAFVASRKGLNPVIFEHDRVGLYLN